MVFSSRPALSEMNTAAQRYKPTHLWKANFGTSFSLQQTLEPVFSLHRLQGLGHQALSSYGSQLDSACTQPHRGDGDIGLVRALRLPRNVFLTPGRHTMMSINALHVWKANGVHS
jgi:hypothetical protein